jgi:hypothetical protein
MPNLSRITAELLAEPHRHSVLQVCTSDLDDVCELLGLGLERRLQLLHCRQQGLMHLFGASHVNRSWNHIVA